MESQQRQAELQQKEQANIRDNETKILIAQMQKEDKNDGIKEPEFSEEAKANLLEKIREFDERLKLDKDKMKLDEKKHKEDMALKRRSLNEKSIISKK